MGGRTLSCEEVERSGGQKVAVRLSVHPCAEVGRGSRLLPANVDAGGIKGDDVAVGVGHGGGADIDLALRDDKALVGGGHGAGEKSKDSNDGELHLEYVDEKSRPATKI